MLDNITSIPTLGFSIDQKTADQITEYQENHIKNIHKGAAIDKDVWAYEFIPGHNLASCKCITCYNKALSFGRIPDTFVWTLGDNPRKAIA